MPIACHETSFCDQMANLCMQEEMADVEFVFDRQNKIAVYLFFLDIFLF